MAVKKRRLRRLSPAPHMVSLQNNFVEIDRLLEIHKLIAGEGPGYKHNVQVLNKSGIVLLVACWEAYVEDLAKNAFDVMLKHAATPLKFPEHVLAIAAKEIKKGETTEIWSLSGDGWKQALVAHKQRILDKYTERNAFNTPSAKNIDKLFSELIGLTSLSSQWHWKGQSAETAQNRLGDLIELRGSIAHRVETAGSVSKTQVTKYKTMISRMAAISHNRVLAFVHGATAARPWRRYRYGKTR